VKFAADSSLLVRLYRRDSKTEAIQRFLEEDNKVLSISELARVEILNVLLHYDERWEQFLADLEEGTRFHLEPLDWRHAFRQAESLARRFSRILKPGGHDLVLVAAAVVVGATWFLSFDASSRQRPLAACAGLRVWPPLNRDEKGLVRHAARQTPD
jgi:predicted nucleic acid-binding protein